MKKAGFIGLGIMGRPMAKNLVKGGVDLMVFDLVPQAVAELEAMGAKGATVAELAAECDVIFTILPNGPIVRNVIFGEGGITSTAKKGTIVVDMSSVTPVESKSFGEGLAKLEMGFVDAPVSGGEPKAIDGTLAYMCGGNEADYEKVVPFFEIMGSSSLLIGPWGSGSVTKLTNQIIVNLTIAAVSEGLVFAAKAGVDCNKVYQAIRGGLAGSTVLDAKAPMMIAHNFKPGGKISINRKDIFNVVNTAHEIDAPVPMSAQLFEIMQALKVDGHMDDDHSGIVQYFEKLAGVQVK